MNNQKICHTSPMKGWDLVHTCTSSPPLHHDTTHADPQACTVSTKASGADGGLTTRELAALLDGPPPLDGLTNYGGRTLQFGSPRSVV
jgi:hypothetical protein